MSFIQCRLPHFLARVVYMSFSKLNLTLNCISSSIDEIIKRNKKEKRANSKAAKAKNKRLANRNNVLKKLNKDGQQSSLFSRRGAFQFQGKAQGTKWKNLRRNPV